MRTIALTFLATFADPDFAGCGTADRVPSEPAALPVAAGPTCEIDADCLIGCTQARCIGFRCARSEPLDADGDGVMPMPCGDDCDDRDPNAFPGANETCDGRDDDCDGTVDEAAPTIVNTFHVTHGFDEAVALPWGDDILVLSSSDERTIDAMKITTDGVELTTQAVELPLAAARDLRQVEAGPGDRHLLAHGADDGSIRYRVVQRTAAGAEVVEGPATLFESAGSVAAFELTAFGASFAVQYGAIDPASGMFRRFLRTTLDGPVIETSPAVIDPLALATDGTNLTVLDPGTFEVTFIDRSGIEVGRHGVGAGAGPWPLLASGEGVVYALLLERHPEIVSIDATGTLSTIAVSPVEGRAFEFFRAGGYFVVGGAFTPSGPWTVEVIDDGGSRLGIVELLIEQPVQRLSAVPWRDGIAVVAGLDGALELAVVARCPASE